MQFFLPTLLQKYSAYTDKNNKVETTGHKLEDIDLSNQGWNSSDDGKNGWE